MRSILISLLQCSVFFGGQGIFIWYLAKYEGPVDETNNSTNADLIKVMETAAKLKELKENANEKIKLKGPEFKLWPNRELPYILSKKILENKDAVDEIMDGILHINTSLSGCLNIR